MGARRRPRLRPHVDRSRLLAVQDLVGVAPWLVSLGRTRHAESLQAETCRVQVLPKVLRRMSSVELLLDDGARRRTTVKCIFFNLVHNDVRLIIVRTTIDIPDEAYRVVKSYARARGLSLGKAVGELVLHTDRPKVTLRSEDGFPTFDLPPDAPVITSEMVRELEDEL